MKRVGTVKAIVTIVIVTGFISGSDCTGPEGPQGPPGPSVPYILGAVGPLPIRITVGGDTVSAARVFITNTPEVPSVRINDIQIPRLFPIPYTGFEFVEYAFPIAAADCATVQVSYTKLDGNLGTAQADIVLPELLITSHNIDSTDTVSLGSSLTLTWTSPTGADGYSIYFYLSYSYLDTLGNYQYFSYYRDTLFPDTSITFSSSLLFPNLAEIDTILYGSGSFSLSAIAGPWQEGDDGNVTGDGIGFFYGFTYGGYLYFVVEGSPYMARRKEEPQNLLQKFLERRARELNLW